MDPRKQPGGRREWMDQYYVSTTTVGSLVAIYYGLTMAVGNLLSETRVSNYSLKNVFCFNK